MEAAARWGVAGRVCRYLRSRNSCLPPPWLAIAGQLNARQPSLFPCLCPIQSPRRESHWSGVQPQAGPGQWEEGSSRGSSKITCPLFQRNRIGLLCLLRAEAACAVSRGASPKGNRVGGVVEGGEKMLQAQKKTPNVFSPAFPIQN